MKAEAGQTWTVDIPPGGTEYSRTVRVVRIDGGYAHVENVASKRKGRIRLDDRGGVAGYKLVPAP